MYGARCNYVNVYLRIFFLVWVGCLSIQTQANNSLTTVELERLDKFWISLSDLDFESLDGFYDDSVILMSRSLLRSPDVGLDDSRSGSEIFSKKEIMSGFYALKNLAPYDEWRALFSEAYSEFSVAEVALLNPQLRGYVYPQDTHSLDLLRTLNYIIGWRQNLVIDENDIALHRYRVKHFPRQHLLFIFDRKTLKIKAQTMMIGVLDGRFFKNNPYAVY